MNRKRLFFIGITIICMTLVAGAFYAVWMIANMGKPPASIVDLSQEMADTSQGPTTTQPAENTSQTPTATPNSTIAIPVFSKTTKSLNISCSKTAEKSGFQLALTIPENVISEQVTLNSACGIALKIGQAVFMLFHSPYESYENQGYSQSTQISSSIPSLYRVNAVNAFRQSGSYKFSVAYTTTLESGIECTESMVTDPTTSPCASPVVNLNKTDWLSVYCGSENSMISACDAIMKAPNITILK